MSRRVTSSKSRLAEAPGVALLAAVLLALLVVASGCQAGEKFPSKPITFVVPYAPGGGSDIMARNIDKVAADIKAIPQNFVVDNKAGGSSAIGKTYMRDKAPDGYTIGVTDDASSYLDLTGATAWKSTEFTPIAKMVIEYNMIVVKADSPYKTLKDFVDAAKAKPKQITVAGTATASADQVQLAVFSKAAGVQYNYIPVDSGGQVVTNVIGGQVEAGLNNPPEAYEQMRAGKLRALGISAPQRITADPLLKDVPTWKESGVDVVISQWRGIAGPPGMKKDQQDWLIGAFKKVSESKQWKDEYIDKFQQVNAFVSGADLQKEIDAERNSFKSLFKDMGWLKRDD